MLADVSLDVGIVDRREARVGRIPVPEYGPWNYLSHSINPLHPGRLQVAAVRDFISPLLLSQVVMSLCAKSASNARVFSRVSSTNRSCKENTRFDV